MNFRSRSSIAVTQLHLKMTEDSLNGLFNNNLEWNDTLWPMDALQHKETLNLLKEKEKERKQKIRRKEVFFSFALFLASHVQDRVKVQGDCSHDVLFRFQRSG